MAIKSKPGDSKIILTIAVAFLAIGMLKDWKWCFYTSLIVGLIGAFSEQLSAYIVFFWDKLSHFLGLVMPNFILAPVFYLFLFPIALLSRIFKKSDSLHLKNNSDSLYKVRDHDYDKSHFENMW